MLARTLAALPEGSRITDYIGVITKTLPLNRVRAVPAASGIAGQRERDSKAGVPHHIGTIGLECTLEKSAIRNSLRIRLFLRLVR